MNSVSGNYLQSLPVEIGKLGSLIYLDVSDNFLRDLPSSIGHLVSLEVLNLDNNRLTNLSETIGRLQSIKELNLRSNELTHLPLNEILQLTTLRRLSLSSNRIQRRELEWLRQQLPHCDSWF